MYHDPDVDYAMVTVIRRASRRWWSPTRTPVHRKEEGFGRWFVERPDGSDLRDVLNLRTARRSWPASARTSHAAGLRSLVPARPAQTAVREMGCPG
jgi:hypothetical protein